MREEKRKIYGVQSFIFPWQVASIFRSHFTGVKFVDCLGKKVTIKKNRDITTIIIDDYSARRWRKFVKIFSKPGKKIPRAKKLKGIV